jgi:hypothetical protein
MKWFRRYICFVGSKLYLVPALWHAFDFTFICFVGMINKSSFFRFYHPRLVSFCCFGRWGGFLSHTHSRSVWNWCKWGYSSLEVWRGHSLVDDCACLLMLPPSCYWFSYTQLIVWLSLTPLSVGRWSLLSWWSHLLSLAPNCYFFSYAYILLFDNFFLPLQMLVIAASALRKAKRQVRYHFVSMASNIWVFFSRVVTKFISIQFTLWTMFDFDLISSALHKRFDRLEHSINSNNRLIETEIVVMEF